MGGGGGGGEESSTACRHDSMFLASDGAGLGHVLCNMEEQDPELRLFLNLGRNSWIHLF
jgi:hypothetical protein